MQSGAPLPSSNATKQHPTAARKKGNAKRKRKPKDGKWTKDKSHKKRKTSNKENVPPNYLGFDSCQEVTNEKGQTEPLKSAFLHKTTAFNNVTRPLIEGAKPDFSKIPSDRPVSDVERNLNGSPVSATTPGGTKLYVGGNIAPPYYVATNARKTNNGGLPKITLPDNNGFYSSEPYQSIKKPDGTFKHVQAPITLKSIKAAKKAKEKLGGKRPGPSQNACMVDAGHKEKEGSATAYTKAFIEMVIKEGIITDADTLALLKKLLEQSQEWFHLVAHRACGVETQDANNLVSASFNANKLVSLIEEIYGSLAKAFDEGFILDATAHLVPKTQIATEIKYLLKLPGGYEIPFEVDAQTTHKPHKIFKLYFIAHMKSLIEEIKQAKSTDTAKQTQTTTTSTAPSVTADEDDPLLIFDDEEKAKEFSPKKVSSPPRKDGTLKGSKSRRALFQDTSQCGFFASKPRPEHADPASQNNVGQSISTPKKN